MNYLHYILALFLVSILAKAQAQTGIGQTAGQIEVNDALVVRSR